MKGKMVFRLILAMLLLFLSICLCLWTYFPLERNAQSLSFPELVVPKSESIEGF
jgi:hypothetical protein